MFALTLGLLTPGRLQAGTLTLNASSNADLSDTNGDNVFDTVNRLDPATFGLYVTHFENGNPGSFERMVRSCWGCFSRMRID